jgi:hypothetical protein
MRKLVGILLCSAPFLWFGLWVLEEKLLKAGVLNTKDMTFVGNETGSAREYLTNVWHWDAALMLLFLVALLCAIVGIVILVSGRRRHHEQVA